MDRHLLEILVCPICKGSLRVQRDSPLRPADAQLELICSRDSLAFPVRDDIPIMLVDEARSLEAGPTQVT
ncbi:MAG: Trm112 family protein [Burkholderiaceae bacterium]